MPVEVARKILGYARAGLPVIVVGTPPDRTPGNTPQDDPALQQVIAELLAAKTVSRVAHESDVPGQIARRWGSGPRRNRSTPSPMLSIRRRDAATRTDYYFFYNQGIVSPPDEPRTLFEPATGEPVDREVQPGRAWTAPTFWMHGPARSRLSSTTLPAAIASRCAFVSRATMAY